MSLTDASWGHLQGSIRSVDGRVGVLAGRCWHVARREGQRSGRGACGSHGVAHGCPGSIVPMLSCRSGVAPTTQRPGRWLACPTEPPWSPSPDTVAW